MRKNCTSSLKYVNVHLKKDLKGKGVLLMMLSNPNKGKFSCHE